MFYLNFCVCLLLFHISVSNGNDLTLKYDDRPRVIVIAAGGMNKKATAGLRLEALIDKGIFSIMSTGFPNSYLATAMSIATGLYPKDHGVYFSPFLDFEAEEWLDMTQEKFYKRKPTVPVWVKNQEQGGKSICVNWPGAHYSYNGSDCTFVLPYDERNSISELSGFGIPKLFDEKEQPNLLMIYYPKPEEVANVQGPDAFAYSRAVRDVDDIVMYIYYQIKGSQLANKTTIFLIGDHDYMPIDLNVRRLRGNETFLDRLHRNNTKLFQTFSPLARFKKDKSQLNPLHLAERFENTLRVATVKIFPHSLPMHWFAGKDLVGDLMFLTTPGHYFYDMIQTYYMWQEKYNWEEESVPSFIHKCGISGYDNSLDLMKGFFLWSGNITKRAPSTPQIDITDVKAYILEALQPYQDDNLDGDSTGNARSNKIHDLAFLCYMCFISCLSCMILKFNILY